MSTIGITFVHSSLISMDVEQSDQQPSNWLTSWVLLLPSLNFYSDEDPHTIAEWTDLQIVNLNLQTDVDKE